MPRGTGVRSLTPEGYDAAVDKIIPGAEDLARKRRRGRHADGHLADVLSRPEIPR